MNAKLVLALFVALLPVAKAADRSWISPVDGNFTDAARWQGGVVPATPDTATLPRYPLDTYTVSLNGTSAEIGGLTIQPLTTLSIGSGGNLSVRSSFSPRVLVDGGSLVVGTGGALRMEQTGFFTLIGGARFVIAPTARFLMPNAQVSLNGTTITAAPTNPFQLVTGSLSTPEGGDPNIGTVFVRKSVLLGSDLRMDTVLSANGYGSPVMTSLLAFSNLANLTLDGIGSQTPWLFSGVSSPGVSAGSLPASNNGVIQGEGIIFTPDFTNFGKIFPGGVNQIGTLSITGNYVSPSGMGVELVFELGGVIPGMTHDQLRVSGAGGAQFGSPMSGYTGFSELRLINGFIPEVGEQFQIVSSLGSNNNIIGNPILPDLPSDRSWDPVTRGNEGIVQVISGDTPRVFEWTHATTGSLLNPANFGNSHTSAPGTMRNDSVIVNVDGGGTPYTASAGALGSRISSFIARSLGVGDADANVAIHADRAILPSVAVSQGTFLVDASEFRVQTFTINGGVFTLTDNGSTISQVLTLSNGSMQYTTQSFYISNIGGTLNATVFRGGNSTNISSNTTGRVNIKQDRTTGAFDVHSPGAKLDGMNNLSDIQIGAGGVTVQKGPGPSPSDGSIIAVGNGVAIVQTFGGCVTFTISNLGAEGPGSTVVVTTPSSSPPISLFNDATAGGVTINPGDETLIARAGAGSAGRILLTALFGQMTLGEGIYEDVSFGTFSGGGFTGYDARVRNISLSSFGSVSGFAAGNFKLDLLNNGDLFNGLFGGRFNLFFHELTTGLPLYAAQNLELIRDLAEPEILLRTGGVLGMDGISSTTQVTDGRALRIAAPTARIGEMSLQDIDLILSATTPTGNSVMTTNGVGVGAGGSLNIRKGVLLESFNSVSASGVGTEIIVNGRLESGGLILFMPGSTLSGNGVVKSTSFFSGDFINMIGANVKPGNSPGILSLIGNTVFSNGTSLDLELAGLTLGLEHDHLRVTGNLTLSGANLSVTLIDGFMPVGPAQFDVLDVTGDIFGTFDNIFLPVLGGGLSWDTSLLYTSGVISVIPEPATASLLVATALAFGLGRRKRGQPAAHCPNPRARETGAEERRSG